MELHVQDTHMHLGFDFPHSLCTSASRNTEGLGPLSHPLVACLSLVAGYVAESQHLMHTIPPASAVTKDSAFFRTHLSGCSFELWHNTGHCMYIALARFCIILWGAAVTSCSPFANKYCTSARLRFSSLLSVEKDATSHTVMLTICDRPEQTFHQPPLNNPETALLATARVVSVPES